MTNEPGELPKYTRWEHERKYLVLPDRPRPWEHEGPWEIRDRYLEAGRLRLRAITDTGSGEQTFKLCKKYPSASAFSQPIVNIYLSAAEYEGLRGLPGRDLVKRRYHDAQGGQVFSIDVFDGDLRGLVLCEIEAPSVEALMAIEFPDYVGAEVTEELALTGGALSRTSAEELARLLEAPFPERLDVEARDE